MLPDNVADEQRRIDILVSKLRTSVNDVEGVLQNVYANHVVLAVAGYVEHATIQILTQYGKNNGNPEISRYIERTVSRNNSLNCAKIKTILHEFDESWWPEIKGIASQQSMASVDSLKALRDEIAHGKPNGTGFFTVSDYYSNCKSFVSHMRNVILQP